MRRDHSSDRCFVSLSATCCGHFHSNATHKKKKRGKRLSYAANTLAKNERQSVSRLDNGVVKKAGESSDGTSKT